METGARAVLMREVNDRIFDLFDRNGWDGESEFLCECGAECGCRVALARDAYRALRQAALPVVAPGCLDARTPSWGGLAASGRRVASI